MSNGGDTTWIGKAAGQTHTGSGSQNNFYYFAAERLVRSGGDPLRMAVDQRVWLSRRFVPPLGYGEAAKRLEDPGTAVLLSGAAGSGRRTAAVVLLHSTGEHTDPFREVALDDRPDEPTQLAGGERVLVDLSSLSDQELVDAQVLVTSYWSKVEQIGGRLAVVLPQEREHLLQSDLRQLLVRVYRPDGSEVLTRHLRRANIKVTPPELHRSVMGRLLERSPMRELQRLSELVVEARSQGGSFHAWAAKAVAALLTRDDEVAEHIAALTDGRQRALLFTAAMLDEAPADAVFRLSARLLTTLGHPEDERPRLDRTDFTQRLAELRVTVSQRRIHFDVLAYGPAVRRHFWLYYPDLRAAFGAWVEETVKGTLWLDQAERRNLVGRFTEQALRAGDVHVLTGLVESWAKETRLLPDAMAVLDQGLRDEQWGAAFRMRIYDWSMESRLQPNLVRGLARICADVMAPHHPDQALVRLHQLARRESAGVPRYAEEALLELAYRQKPLFEKLLGRVCEGMERRDPWHRDVAIFLRMVAPPPSEARREEMVRGWRGVFSVASAEVWANGIETWLAAARHQLDGGARLMGILIDAADGAVDVLSRCYLLAYDWAVSPDDTPGQVSRADVASKFCREIDRAQGIEPLNPASVGTAEGRNR